jgi:hypothetical protein
MLDVAEGLDDRLEPLQVRFDLDTGARRERTYLCTNVYPGVPTHGLSRHRR